MPEAVAKQYRRWAGECRVLAAWTDDVDRKRYWQEHAAAYECMAQKSGTAAQSSLPDTSSDRRDEER